MIPKEQRFMYIAFPGMGKSMYAMTHPGVIDLDFGYYRSSLKISPRENGKLYDPFVRLAVSYATAGYKILTNEPGIIPAAKQAGFLIVVEVPSDLEDLVTRVKLRDGDSAFTRELARSIGTWVSGWRQKAEKYGLQLVTAKYFKEVNMPYEDGKQ